MTHTYRLPIVVLISGNGSNLQSIINATTANLLPIDIRAVISSNGCAYGLQRAIAWKIPTEVIELKDFNSRNDYEKALASCIAHYSPELIVLAGFMHILYVTMLTTFKKKIINIHPSLLPSYPGLHTHRLALADGCSYHGCSIHYVDEHLDAGPLIAQASVPIHHNDTPELLEERVHAAEHFLYPTVLNWFAHRRIQLIDNQVVLDNVHLLPGGLRFTLKSP